MLSGSEFLAPASHIRKYWILKEAIPAVGFGSFIAGEEALRVIYFDLADRLLWSVNVWVRRRDGSFTAYGFEKGIVSGNLLRSFSRIYMERERERLFDYKFSYMGADSGPAGEPPPIPNTDMV